MELLVNLAIICSALVAFGVVEFGFWGLAVLCCPKADWKPVRLMLILASVVGPAFVFFVQLARTAVAAAGLADIEGVGVEVVLGTPVVVFAVIAINIWALDWWSKRTPGKESDDTDES